MSLTVNLEIFDRVKAVIAETGRINMLYWAEVRGSVMGISANLSSYFGARRALVAG